MQARSRRKEGTGTYKLERIEARVSAQEKAIFAKAAAIQGRTLTEFVVSTLHEASSRVIESYEVMRLAEQDRETFVHAMLNPPEPSENLKRAVKRYLEHGKEL